MTTIGLIGAGNIGQALARLAIDHGHDVVLSNSRGPETLSGLVDELGPHADADTAEGAATRGDLVVVTIPLKAYRDVPVAPLAEKIVVDTNNYYPRRDGHIPELDDGSTTSSRLLQQHLPSSRVVKAFNHIMASHLLEHGHPTGTEARRALAVAGDDVEAKATVTALIESFGFDVVDAGTLDDSWRYQPGTPAYVVRLDADELRAALAAARR
jgi:8-hydroxy-5-deazaflavin:NADPH oxidoreductase